ncbi:hypothetical protein E9993_13780 [Labilibacter sediminis]|nr:hypothetical protein E9993_13780 [Labilibacter sediminis]
MKNLLLSAMFLGLIAVSCGGKKEKKAEAVQEETKVEAVEVIEEVKAADSTIVEVADSLEVVEEVVGDSIQ